MGAAEGVVVVATADDWVVMVALEAMADDDDVHNACGLYNVCGVCFAQKQPSLKKLPLQLMI